MFTKDASFEHETVNFEFAIATANRVTSSTRSVMASPKTLRISSAVTSVSSNTSCIIAAAMTLASLVYSALALSLSRKLKGRGSSSDRTPLFFRKETVPKS
jgi:hypothetical protein